MNIHFQFHTISHKTDKSGCSSNSCPAIPSHASRIPGNIVLPLTLSFPNSLSYTRINLCHTACSDCPSKQHPVWSSDYPEPASDNNIRTFIPVVNEPTDPTVVCNCCCYVWCHGASVVRSIGRACAGDRREWVRDGNFQTVRTFLSQWLTSNVIMSSAPF